MVFRARPCNSGRQAAPRFFITLVEVLLPDERSFSSSLTIAPCRPAARSSAVRPRQSRSCRPGPCCWPAPRSLPPWRARRRGSSACSCRRASGPDRSSRKIVTTFSMASSAPAPRARNVEAARPARVTRLRTMSISVSSVLGVGRTTMLNRRLRAADMSLTPRSRVLAVAITENPLAAGDLGGQLRHGNPLLRQQRDHRVLHFGGAAGDFLEPGKRAGFHRAEDRALDQGLGLGPWAISIA